MKNICIYFQIHHPFSLQTYRYFDIGGSKLYYDDYRIEKEITDAISNYYLPANKFLIQLIKKSKGKLKLSFHISGTALDQFLMYAPNIFHSFRELIDTGQVELTGGTASHSIASLAANLNEFKNQVKQNKERIQYYFGQNPNLFINADLMYTNQLAGILVNDGYRMILTNGSGKMLQWRSPDYLYSCEGQNKLGILFRNEKISNEFSSIFQNSKKNIKPQPVDQFLTSIQIQQSLGPILNIYLNYNILGGYEHKSKQLLFQKIVTEIINDESFCFSLPSELLEKFGPVAEIGSNEPICWKEHFHSSYFPGNELQKDAMNQLFKLEKLVTKTQNSDLRIDWRYLQTADHFHLMDENHPVYHAPEMNPEIYRSKYDAFINFMNVLEDFKQRLKKEIAIEKNKKDSEFSQRRQ